MTLMDPDTFTAIMGKLPRGTAEQFGFNPQDANPFQFAMDQIGTFMESGEGMPNLGDMFDPTDDFQANQLLGTVYEAGKQWGDSPNAGTFLEQAPLSITRHVEGPQKKPLMLSIQQAFLRGQEDKAQELLAGGAPAPTPTSAAPTPTATQGSGWLADLASKSESELRDLVDLGIISQKQMDEILAARR